MVNIELKGGVVKEFDDGITAMEVAKSLGMGLYKAACVCRIDGEVKDLRTQINKDCKLEILTFDDDDGKRALRHTASHVLAQAVKRLYPEAKLAIGPAIDNGFYYDFDVDVPFTPEVLEKIEAEMKKIVKEALPLERYELDPDEAIAMMEKKGEPYKVELIKEHAGKGEKISFFRQGEFDELCKNKVIDFMPGQSDNIDKGGTLRLGAYPCVIKPGTTMERCYGKSEISERHRHRYEFNNDYRDILTQNGLTLSGLSPDGRLVETVELSDRPFYVGVQYHPEFKSRPNKAHPLFKGFIAAALEKSEIGE